MCQIRLRPELGGALGGRHLFHQGRPARTEHPPLLGQWHPFPYGVPAEKDIRVVAGTMFSRITL